MRAALLLGLLLAQRFYPDDPITTDADNLPIDHPSVIELSATYDLLEHTFARREVELPIPRAMNVNTLGEVPNSSWFTNRIGVREMSLEELATGPRTAGAPDVTRPLTIIAAKQGGITPGFRVRDSKGDVYFVKFDPKAHPSLSTGADVISSTFFHAIGYNVPEAHIVYVNADHFVIHASAVINLPGGKAVEMDREYLEFMLAEAAKIPDGNVRAVASLMVPGDIVGPFQFHGTRPDDANDIFPHEHRRELRGYRVFCAWLNHDDSRSLNTLDAYANGHITHYLIDFGSTLGSGSDVLRNIAPQDPRAGNEYFIDLDAAWKTLYTFGWWERPWRNVRYPYPMYAEAGRIEADFFDPAAWKPEYPNTAFDRMLSDDAFWAAKIVARFSDEAIRAIVDTGDFMSADATRYLADTLIQRRDKVVSHYFRRVNPLDGFRIDGGVLTFRHLDAEQPGEFRYEWFSFDNDNEETAALGVSGRTVEEHILIPPADDAFLMVRIRSDDTQVPAWGKSVDVYLRRGANGREVVGIDREL